jgi:hypothetical protein
MLEPTERWLHSQRLIVKREFQLPWGLCDIVGCSFNGNKVKMRMARGQTTPIGTPVRVHLLSLVPDVKDDRSIGLGELLEAFRPFLDEDKLALELHRLVRGKFVIETPDGTYQKVNGWIPLHKRLVAVELKLTRISDVLHQAVNNLGFADESYVGLPMEIAKRLSEAEKKDEFQQRGIGILGIDPEDCKVILRSNPAKAIPDEVIQTHCVERFWRTYLKDS